MFVMMSLGVLMVSSGHPLVLLSVLICFTLKYSLDIYFLMGSFWYGYVLLLVVLSGVMVLFTYMVSFCPNDSFDYFGVVGCLVGGLLVGFSVMSWVGEGVVEECFVLWECLVSVVSLYAIVGLLIMMIGVVWMSSSECGPVRVE